MCNKLLGPEVRAKYKKNYRPPVTKPKPPQKFFNSDIVTARPRGKPNIVTAKPRIVTAKPKLVTAKPAIVTAKSKSTVTAKPLPFTSLPVKKKDFRQKDKTNNEKKNKSSRGKNKRKNKNKLKETERSSSAGRGGFVVVSDPERRLRLRSYWMRAG